MTNEPYNYDVLYRLESHTLIKNVQQCLHASLTGHSPHDL